jgi:2,3-bisphosphoglycerate-dependent phosphoglycerate mutase
VVEIVYETHSISVDNERGIATGWLDGELSAAGRQAATELGARRRDDGVAAVFSSDLGRAIETVDIAFAGSDLPIHHDNRLRECDYGERNGTPVSWFEGRRREFVDTPYPGGESWRDAVDRLRDFLDELAVNFDGQRVVVIGHGAQRYGFEHLVNGTPLEDLVDRSFDWQEGWGYSYG